MQNIRNYKLSLLVFVFLFSCQKQLLIKQSNIGGDLTSQLKYNKDWSGPYISVHRGGGELENYPENCIESFTYFTDQFPVFIECDIEMSKDSVLFMMHDNTLDRTTTGKGKISEKTWAEISQFHLKDNFGNVTAYKIPKLSEVLQWSKTHAILTLDIKKNTPLDRVVKEVHAAQAQNTIVMISYNANEAKLINDLDPNLMISVGIMQISDYERLTEYGIPDEKMIAFVGTREPKKEVIDFIHSKGILTILGSLGNLDKKALNSKQNLYQLWRSAGVDIFATDYPLNVYEQIKN